MIKDKNKEVYTSPITEALELQFEGCLCLSGGKSGAAGQAGGDWTSSENFFDYGDF